MGINPGYVAELSTRSLLVLKIICCLMGQILARNDNKLVRGGVLRLPLMPNRFILLNGSHNSFADAVEFRQAHHTHLEVTKANSRKCSPSEIVMAKARIPFSGAGSNSSVLGK